MAERKPNGGGAASTSLSGTNLLFSSSATEFSFNVPFIPVTQAAAASASLLLPGGSEEMGVWWAECVGEAGEGRVIGWRQSDLRFSFCPDPAPCVAKFEWPGCFRTLEAGSGHKT